VQVGSLKGKEEPQFPNRVWFSAEARKVKAVETEWGEGVAKDGRSKKADRETSLQFYCWEPHREEPRGSCRMGCMSIRDERRV